MTKTITLLAVAACLTTAFCPGLRAQCAVSVTGTENDYNPCSGMSNQDCSGTIVKTITYTLSCKGQTPAQRLLIGFGAADSWYECPDGAVISHPHCTECWPRFLTPETGPNWFMQTAQNVYASEVHQVCFLVATSPASIVQIQSAASTRCSTPALAPHADAESPEILPPTVSTS